MTINEKYYSIMNSNDLTFLDNRCNETDSVENAICFEHIDDARMFLKTLDNPDEFFVAELNMKCDIKRM